MTYDETAGLLSDCFSKVKWLSQRPIIPSELTDSDDDWSIIISDVLLTHSYLHDLLTR